MIYFKTWIWRYFLLNVFGYFKGQNGVWLICSISKWIFDTFKTWRIILSVTRFRSKSKFITNFMKSTYMMKHCLRIHFQFTIITWNNSKILWNFEYFHIYQDMLILHWFRGTVSNLGKFQARIHLTFSAFLRNPSWSCLVNLWLGWAS